MGDLFYTKKIGCLFGLEKGRWTLLNLSLRMGLSSGSNSKSNLSGSFYDEIESEKIVWT